MPLLDRLSDGHPTGERFTTEAPAGKIRIVVFNQMTADRFFKDYGNIGKAKKDAKSRWWDKDIIVRIFDDHGKCLFESGEGWND